MFGKQQKWVAILSIIALLFSLFPLAQTQVHAAEASSDSACSYITVDGVKDDLWNSVPVLGSSETAGWQGYQINNLKITNDCTYLYYWVDAVKVDNWGDNGFYLNLALSINGGAGAQSEAAAPWGTAFNFSTAEHKPDFHVLSRIKQTNELNGAAVYASSDLSNPLAASWGESNGAQFANSIQTGFEGRIPLALLGLGEGDTVQAIAVLSGNEGAEHGAFDVIPETPDNMITDSWQQSAEPNTLANYTQAYSISFAQPELVMTGSTPGNGEYDVSVELSDITLGFLGELAWADESLQPIVSAGDSIVPTEASIANNAIAIKLLERLKYDTAYTVTIPAGAIAGLAEDKIITFTTEKDPGALNTYNIHYFRYDGKQTEWDIWTWEDGRDGREVDFSGTDENGFATTAITSFAGSIYVITRPGSWSSQEPDRIITMPAGQNAVDVWLVEGDTKVYYSFEELNLGETIQSAYMDSLTTIDVATTKELADEQLEHFYIENSADNSKIEAAARRLGDRRYRLTVAANEIDVTKAYTVGHAELTGTRLVYRNVLDDKQFYYNGSDLGLSYNKTASTFKLWAPTASEVAVAIYDDAGQYNSAGKVVDHTGGVEVTLERSSNGVWSGTVNGDLAGKYYMYRVEFADGTSNYVVDPYARAVAANGARTAIVDLAATDPDRWQQDSKPPFINATDAIIYELHIRDFSISDSSGVSEANKGKYAAFTETGLVDEHGNALGIDHLAELGITHVHLLPAYDFQTVNELTVNDPASSNPKFNWGYDPQNYNVPEGSYSSDAANPTARITEFKQMVQALHEKGIRVVMDVVYNHTYSIEDGPFNKIVPGYYYRTNSDGSYSNGSGVGNEIATERPMVRKYIKDSVSYWAKEYNVDGFRFDLMGIIDTTTMKELTEELHSEVDPSILIYGEPWMGGSTPLPGSEQTVKGSQKNLDFAVFNDNFRSAIKGDSDGAGKGFATGNLDTVDGLVHGIKGATDDFTAAPTETINYVTAHDNLNLWDKVLNTQGLFEELGMLNIKDGVLLDGGDVAEAVANAKPYRDIDPEHVLENETVKRSLLANGIVLTSQGIPFIHAGDELLRSKYGDHNSYRSPDAVNQINWSNKASFTDVNEYYKGLIKLRKEHPAFRMTTKEEINSKLQVLQRDNGIVAFKLGEHANYDAWKNIIVVYNGAGEARSLSLPAGEWKIVVDESAAGTAALATVSDSVTVEPISMMVLYDESNDYEAKPASIELNIARKAIEAGKETVATAVVKDQQGRTMAGQPIVWSSSNEAVAAVSSSGRITALGNGVTTITATLGGLSKSIELHVAKLVPAALTLQGESFVYEGFTTKLMPAVKDQFDQVISSPLLSWKSSDTSIATVNSSGLVTGVSAGRATITAEIGTISASYTIEVKPYVKRYIQFEYSRPDQDYSEWDMWVWNTGVQNDAMPFTVKDGKAIALVEIGPAVTQIGFIVRRGGDQWLEKDTEADRVVNVRLDESFVVVKLTSGQASFTQTAYISGPVITGSDVTFYYRNDELYRSNEQHRLSEVKLAINGQTYPMAYDEAGEYYYYTLEGLEEGEYPYTFLATIDGKQVEINDPKNTVDGVSKIVYRVIDIEATASATPQAFNYNTHSILTIKTDAPAADISRIYADLTALGGRADVEIDKQLKALTLSVADAVTAGEKTIPVIIVDSNNVEHRFAAQVTVQPRHVSNSHDFDWDEARIYFMLTDRFNDGDESNNDPNGENYDKEHLQTYHGGDFQGIIDRLDYLQELGINTIWITPIVDNIDWNVGNGQSWEYQYGYHGYWAKDFTKLDEHLGDLDTFKELIDKAHDRGIKIMVDVVINHVGYGMNSQSERLDVSNYPTEEEQAVFDGMIRTSPVPDHEVLGELAGLPDLVTEDPGVREQIVQWQVDWLQRARTDRGDTIDYFRVDTVKHVENATWMHFKNELTKVSPEFKLIGEVYSAYVDDQRGYLGSGMMDSLLDFNFKHIAGDFINGKIDSVEQRLQARNEKLNSAATFGQFLSSHDEDGFLATFAQGDLSKQKIAATLQITAKGQPVIYYGEELGMSGTNANFDNGNLGSNRYDMPWEELEQRSDMLTHYQKVLAARAQYSKVFAKGTRTKLAGGDADQYIVFERAYKGDEVYVGINTSDSEQTVSFAVDAAAGTRLKELYSGEMVTVSAERTVTLELPARSAGGTFILAAPAPVVVNPHPGTEAPVADSSIIRVDERYLSGDQYKIALEKADATIQLTPDQLSKPVSIAAGDIQLTITAAQLQAWSEQYATIELKLAEAGSAVSQMITEQAKQLAAEVKLLTAPVSIEATGKTAAGETSKLISLGAGTALKLSAAEQDEGLTNVYRVLDDGKLQYVSAKLVDGSYQLATDEAGTYVVASYMKHFTDVDNSHWAAELIKQAAAKQLVEGKSLDAFDPNGAITRAEFTMIVARIFSLSSSAATPFADVEADSWYASAVAGAYEAGLINGMDEHTFAPNRSITREEMAVLLVRALEYKVGTELDQAEISYADAETISQWALDAIGKATAAEIIEGKGNDRFDPKGLLTRAEAVKVLLALEQR